MGEGMGMKRYTIIDDTGLLNGINERETLNGKWVTYNDCQIEIIGALSKERMKGREIGMQEELESDNLKLREINRKMKNLLKRLASDDYIHYQYLDDIRLVIDEPEYDPHLL